MEDVQSFLLQGLHDRHKADIADLTASSLKTDEDVRYLRNNLDEMKRAINRIKRENQTLSKSVQDLVNTNADMSVKITHLETQLSGMIKNNQTDPEPKVDSVPKLVVESINDASSASGFTIIANPVRRAKFYCACGEKSDALCTLGCGIFVCDKRDCKITHNNTCPKNVFDCRYCNKVIQKSLMDEHNRDIHKYRECGKCSRAIPSDYEYCNSCKPSGSVQLGSFIGKNKCETQNCSNIKRKGYGRCVECSTSDALPLNDAEFPRLQ